MRAYFALTESITLPLHAHIIFGIVTLTTNNVLTNTKHHSSQA